MTEQSQLKGHSDSFEVKVLGDKAFDTKRNSLGPKSITLRTSMTREELFLSFRGLFYSERPNKIEIKFKEGGPVEIDETNCSRLLKLLRGDSVGYLMAEYFKEGDE